MVSAQAERMLLLLQTSSAPEGHAGRTGKYVRDLGYEVIRSTAEAQRVEDRRDQIRALFGVVVAAADRHEGSPDDVDGLQGTLGIAHGSQVPVYVARPSSFECDEPGTEPAPRQPIANLLPLSPLQDAIIGDMTVPGAGHLATEGPLSDLIAATAAKMADHTVLAIEPTATTVEPSTIEGE